MCLIVVTILLILGSSFLAFLGRDYRFAGYQERTEQAWYLALAGLEYYRALPTATPPEAANPLRRYVPAGQTSHFFEVVVRPDGTVVSKGVVTGTLAGIAGQVPTVERAVIVPQGAMDKAYDATL